MMSSGVKWNEDYTDPKSDVAQAGFTGSEPGMDPLVSYMRHLPRAAEPGTKWHYDTGETDMVGIMVSNAVGEPLSQYLSEKVWIHLRHGAGCGVDGGPIRQSRNVAAAAFR